MNELPEVLKNCARRNIRYAMFRLKSGTTNDMTDVQMEIYEAVKAFYSVQDGWDGWNNFTVTWDIGTDDENVLSNWDDPSRSDKWWTWGISKFKVVRRIGLTYAINKEEGRKKSFPGIMDYFVALGFSAPDGKGSYKLDVKKLMAEVETRDKWTPLVETEHTLTDAEAWQQHYYQNDIILHEIKEN